MVDKNHKGERTGGTVKTIHQHQKLTLEQLQKLVGGYIQVFNLPLDKTNLVTNEDGKLMGMMMNNTATKLLHENYPHTVKYGDFVVGDVVILHGDARITRR